MALRIVRLGTPRGKREGLRLGTVRRPPRGVRREELAKRNYFDVWLPEVAPSAELASWALSKPWTDQRWRTFTRRYLGEMRRPASARLLTVLAAMSHHGNFSVGCYCEDESRCHRSLLRVLLVDRGARIVRRA